MLKDGKKITKLTEATCIHYGLQSFGSVSAKTKINKQKTVKISVFEARSRKIILTNKLLATHPTLVCVNRF